MASVGKLFYFPITQDNEKVSLMLTLRIFYYNFYFSIIVIMQALIYTIALLFLHPRPKLRTGSFQETVSSLNFSYSTCTYYTSFPICSYNIFDVVFQRIVFCFSESLIVIANYTITKKMVYILPECIARTVVKIYIAGKR